MDAKDFLNRLTDLLYDESMAFSSTDKDGMKEVIETDRRTGKPIGR